MQYHEKFINGMYITSPLCQGMDIDMAEAGQHNGDLKNMAASLQKSYSKHVFFKNFFFYQFHFSLFIRAQLTSQYWLS